MKQSQGEVAPANLDELVTAVATTLMGVESSTVATAARSVLRTLVEYFEIDQGFLRFHDLVHRSTVLVAEWPPREFVPDPDPLGTVYFETADPTFAASEHISDVMIIRPDADSSGYQERVRHAAGVPATSFAAVPLRAGGSTTGTIGAIKFGDRGWSHEEIRALRTIATLLVQMQGRLLAEDRLRHIALHDELTGLPNRRALLAHLQAMVDTGAPGRRALLFVDLDRLKAMNDFLGHEAGDRFIVAVSERLRAAVRPDDMVARLGGDEFVLALGGFADDAQAQAVATRIQREMSEPIRLGGQSMGRTVSIGVAVMDPTSVGISEWLRGADLAVLAAKGRGGNAVVLFTAEMQAQDEVRVAVEMNLLSAIRSDLLTLHYQPVIDLPSRRMVGAEALLRWNHPTLGAVPPDLFVGVAEATNLAGELGQWVLNEACRQLAAWRRELGAAAAGFTVAVNVSPVQLIAIDFVDRVARALATHGLEGSALTLEITEHAVVSDLSAALTTLHGLRRLGVSVAIDDFGTGYSSLAQLKALPVTILKIDRGFVSDLGTSVDDLAIVRSIVGLAEAFGLDLIAEGVETEVGAGMLSDLGCRSAQGFLFSRAVPATTIGEALRAVRPAG